MAEKTPRCTCPEDGALVFLGHRKDCPEVAPGWDRNVRAIVFNAVAPALDESGRWLPLTVRKAIADRVLSDLAAHGYKITRNEENR